ncbi:hypothetical protein GCM10010249_08040 [Streptomyces roseolilacinus]|uniref:Tyr recombinase domain-containing protein n=1 Tax=Streptomyces roseolilacinus TaxID=66904 RepID=A0A918EJS9_9ACTN|nr:hypothetical protein GCM10010249_08040 [Streptomyces roseolilacinus]
MTQTNLHPRPRSPHPRRLRQFLDTARADRLHALYKLALRAGLHTELRKGDRLGLHWEDLDLTTGTATIRRSLQRTRTGDLTHLPAKTRAPESRIALPTECLHSLKEHRGRQGRERGQARSAWSDSGSSSPRRPVGLSARPTSHTASAASSTGPGSAASASTTSATLLLEQGVELIIKELFGHAHIGVTATVYAHARLRLQRDAIDTLSTALGGQETTKTVSSDGDETTLRRPRPLTLPSTTVVTPRRSPARTHLAGLHLFAEAS